MVNLAEVTFAIVGHDEFSVPLGKMGEMGDVFGERWKKALHNEVPTLIGAPVDQTTRAEWFEVIRG